MQTMYASLHALNVSVLNPIWFPAETQVEYVEVHPRTQVGSELETLISEML